MLKCVTSRTCRLRRKVCCVYKCSWFCVTHSSFLLKTEVRRATRRRFMQNMFTTDDRMPGLGTQTSGLDESTCLHDLSNLPVVDGGNLAMQDKQAVEAYKANIKAKLTRAGLIRGQPRSALVQATNVGNTMITATSQSRSAQQFSRKSVADIRQSTSSNILNAFESEMSFVEASHSHPHSMTILPALPG